MWDRISLFLPNLGIIAAIALLSTLVLRWIDKKYGKDLNSVSWVAKNWKGVIRPVALFIILIYAPFREELIFRAILVIIFPEVTRNAWYAILISAAVFAAWHVPNTRYLGGGGWLKKYKEGTLESDDLEAESSKLRKENLEEFPKGTLPILRVLTFVYPFSIGIVAGYFGIKYQSLWIPVLVHFLVNLLGPLMVIGTSLLLMLVVATFFLAKDRLWYVSYLWRNKRRMRKLKRLERKRSES